MSKVSDLNDALRKTLAGGRVVLTHGVNELPLAQINALMARIRAFDAFTEDDDPYGEHDFGAVDVGDVRVFWKIDCYDLDMNFASPDPTDPKVTTRVLTIMLASEY